MPNDLARLTLLPGGLVFSTESRSWLGEAVGG
jgi:hypothetical protein